MGALKYAALVILISAAAVLTPIALLTGVTR